MSDWRETTEDVLMRIRDYIGHGGLFNPDLMDHDKVRDLVMDCRAAIAAALAEIDRLTAEVWELKQHREEARQRVRELQAVINSPEAR